MPREEKKIKVEVANPKTKEEWEQTINRINEFLFYKYTKKDSRTPARNMNHM